MVHLQKTKEKSKNLKRREIHDIFIEKKLDKVCFQHGIAYGKCKDLTSRAASDKILCDNKFNIAKNPKYEKIQTEQLKMKIFMIKSLLKNYTNQLLENSRKEKYTHLS